LLEKELLAIRSFFLKLPAMGRKARRWCREERADELSSDTTVAEASREGAGGYPGTGTAEEAPPTAANTASSQPSSTGHKGKVGKGNHSSTGCGVQGNAGKQDHAECQGCAANQAKPTLAGRPSELVADVSKSLGLREPVHVDSVKDSLSCPLMGPEEVASISVPFTEIEARLKQVLEQHGAAIVTDVLSAQDSERMEGLFAADLCELLDMSAAKQAGQEVEEAAKRATANIRNWPMSSVSLLGQMERCQLRGLPHGRFAWAARLHPNVRRTYEVIHDTNQLVSSCDNSFFATPAHREQTSTRNWPHVDHNKHDYSEYDDEGVPISEWEVYQGLLYVWGANTSHASTTVVWTGSHRDVYEELMADSGMERRGRKSVHFSQLAYMNSQEASHSLCHRWRREARRMPMPPGSLLLWSSKTVHQGWSGGPRLVQPVCWEPVGRRTERSYERKLRMAALGLPSTHWASLGQPHTLVDIRPAEPTTAGRTKNGIALPLKSTLQPATLAAGVNVQEMWGQLQKPSWEKPLPQSLKELLLRSIKPEIANAL